MKRVLRGGSWYRTPDLLRVAIRSRTDPNFCYDGVGFRVMRKDGAGRALRGGSLNYFPGTLRVARRLDFGPGDRYGRVGFRVMRRVG